MILKQCNFDPILIDSCCFRKGILITFTNQEGKSATAEVSPLPGFSHETLGEALKQLQLLKRRLLTTWWTKQGLHHLSNLGLYASVHFGVESALLDLLDPIEDTPCKKYALLIGSKEEILFRAEEAHLEGFTQAKIKLGHLTPKVSHEIIQTIGDKFRFRIDLNRKWDLKDSLEFCAEYPEDFFEYIEEPATNAYELPHFPYPFALDETLRDYRTITPLLQLKALKALIIKPTMIYPFGHFLHLGPKIIITSSFEGHTGISQLQRLIQRLDQTDTYHGLDSLRYFENQYETVSDCALAKAST